MVSFKENSRIPAMLLTSLSFTATACIVINCRCIGEAMLKLLSFTNCAHVYPNGMANLFLNMVTLPNLVTGSHISGHTGWAPLTLRKYFTQFSDSSTGLFNRPTAYLESFSFFTLAMPIVCKYLI